MGKYKQIRQKNYQTPAHILVWESHHGKKPLSMIVHHIDGNNQNNNIDNLQLVTHYEHKKIHNGWIRDGNGILFNPKMEKRRQIRIEKKENIIKKRKENKVIKEKIEIKQLKPPFDCLTIRISPDDKDKLKYIVQKKAITITSFIIQSINQVYNNLRQ